MKEEKSWIDKCKFTACELTCDDDDSPFEERMRKLIKLKLVEKPE